MKAAKEHKLQESRVIQHSNNRQRNSPVAQFFKVPDDLVNIIDDVNTVAEDIYATNNEQIVLPGADIWARDTRWATRRKLEEWDLVKLLYNETPELDEGNFIIGFGLDNTNEPDGLVRDENTEKIIWAGENKLVTGQLQQVNTNIRTALTQLCTSNRAQNYKGCHLIARINISPISPAAISFQQIEREDQYKLIAKWIKTAEEYASLACNNDNNNRLTLIICLDNQTISHVDFPSEKFDLQELSEQEV